MNDRELEPQTMQAADPPQDADVETENRAADSILNRIEQSLTEMRVHMSATARESRHKDFSFTLLAGAVAQALVLALLAWALSDTLFGQEQPLGQALLKLGFATVLQLAALTAFVVGRAAR